MKTYGYRIPSDRQFSSNSNFLLKVMSNVKKKSLKKTKYQQRNGGFKFQPEVNKIIRLIDIFSALFSNQFFHLKRTLQGAKNHRQFVPLPPNFDSGQIKVIPQYCIAQPYCARFLRHQRAQISACTYTTKGISLKLS